jgi:hypothetical protein
MSNRDVHICLALCTRLLGLLLVNESSDILQMNALSQYLDMKWTSKYA